jgi:hypothetical protein
MIEEIIPAFTTHKKVKMLSADTDILDKLPAIDSHISFLPFVKFLKEKLVSTSGTRTDFYRYLIRKFEAEPALLEKVTNVQVLNDHEELLELLSTAIFPVVSEEEKNNFTLSSPYQFNVFSYSESFKKLFIDKAEEHLKLPDEISEEQLREVQCSMIYDHILEKYYGIKLNDSPELVYPVTDAETGLKRYYRMRYDRRFIDVHVKGELPRIQDCAVCLNTFRILNLEKQMKTMPLDLFEVEGFAVWVAEDVTNSESLERMKKILLRQDLSHAESIKQMKEAVQALVGLNNVEIGIMPFVKINNCFLLNEDYTKHSLLGRDWKANDDQANASLLAFVNFINEQPEPMPVSNVTESLFGFATFLRPLFENGTRSFLYYPMQNSDGLLGMLELSSPVPNLLTHEVMARLEPAIPLLSVAMLKTRDAFNDKIEKLVKEKFTALQPSVEWKFSEVAWDYLKRNGSATDTGKIIFENVYPLYGAIDIRNSSTERNHAIQKDLKQHLRLIDETLDKLQSIVKLTLLDGLKFKNKNFQQAIENVLLPEDEVRINEFLENEVEPICSHLRKGNINVEPIAGNYFTLQQNCQGPLYHYRNEYEESLASINQALIRYLEEQEIVLQKSYPHYFEKYRTDGVEYNIYIGQSMAPSHPFDLLYLKNIRLWQLQSMAEMARITHQLLPSLKVPLETTQLILIHNQPISISFRKDERRFDVEGSYNIRYEIMKKRIDKARLKDTQERLTQPGKISMVYGNQKEAQEYEEYIHFLQSKDLLNPGIENVELEELQGVRGLKALRVDINLE